MMLLELFGTFFMIGAFTFGGGYAMIAMIQQQVVARGWLDAESLIDFVAVAESTPGPLAVNMATYVGAELGGIAGSLCATLGVVLPSFLVILLVARSFQAFCRSKVVGGIMSGLKPAVVGLIASAAVSVAMAVFAPGGWSAAVLAEPETWFWAAVGGVMLFGAFRFPKLHPIAIICICGAIGILAGYLGI